MKGKAHTAAVNKEVSITQLPILLTSIAYPQHLCSQYKKRPKRKDTNDEITDMIKQEQAEGVL